LLEILFFIIMLRILHTMIFALLMCAHAMAQYTHYTMADSVEQMRQWNRYPTYQVYRQMMRQWAGDYPSVASLVEVGKSAGGREILGLRITAPGDTTLRTPVLISSSIHGNETTGYLLSLRLIDSLCKADYNTGSRLLSRCVIYVVPLLNPDGTYRLGDSTVRGFTRENANNVDLNRNFPGGSHTEREPETQSVINLCNSRRFAFSISLHGGDEVVNYPWDSYMRGDMSLPDLQWWRTISERYVATCRKLNDRYLRSVCDEGHVYGSDWYRVDGGMQDWQYSAMRCRETTLELSNTKTIYPENLDYYWNLTREAITDFLGNAAVGFCGRITDLDGNPIEDATVLIEGHDENCSSVITRKDGSYFRPTLPDQRLEVCVVANGYVSQCMSISTEEDTMEELNFSLMRNELATASEILEPISERITSLQDRIVVECGQDIALYQLYNINGQMMLSGNPQAATFEIPTHNLRAGIYVVRIENHNYNKTQKIAILK